MSPILLHAAVLLGVLATRLHCAAGSRQLRQFTPPPVAPLSSNNGVSNGNGVAGSQTLAEHRFLKQRDGLCKLGLVSGKSPAPVLS